MGETSKSLPRGWSFIAGVGIVPLIVAWIAFLTSFDFPLLDDQLHAQPAFEFAATWSVTVSDLSAPTGVFEAVWGGGAASLFGSSHGVLRASTTILSILSAGFLHGIVKALSASPTVSRLVAAAYLFNPMFFSLSATYMTDAHATALSVIAIWAYVRAFERPMDRWWYLLLGSMISSVAFLSRQQSLVIPVALIVVVALSRGWVHKLQDASLIGFLPLTTVLLHELWMRNVGPPPIRALSILESTSWTLPQITQITALSGFLGLEYLGLFVLPVSPLIVGLWTRRRINRDVLSIPLIVTVAVAALGLGLVFRSTLVLNHDTWWTRSGLGPIDRAMLGSRASIVGDVPLLILTVCSVVVSWIFINHQARVWKSKRDTVGRFLMLSMVGFAIAAIIGGLAFHGLSLDRYWVPLLPLALILLATTATRIGKLGLALAWTAVAVLAAISIAGTRDALTAQSAANVWASELTVVDVPLERLDAGASWTALKFGVPEVDLNKFPVPGPFWVSFYAPGLRPEYFITLEPLEGLDVLDRREYSSWLDLRSTYLFVSRRDPDLGAYLTGEDSISRHFSTKVIQPK